MGFTLHHVGITCRDSSRSREVYVQRMGNRVATNWQVASEVDITFVGRGSDVSIELVGAPYQPYGRHHLDRSGATASHLGFLVDDVDLAFERMREDDVRILWDPKDFMEIRHFGMLDNNGVLVELFSAKNGSAASPEIGGPVRLHHVSLLTPDLRATERFFVEKLHMKTVIEHTENDGGFIFMVDEGFDYRTHNFMVEVIGPPRGVVSHATALLEPREQKILEKHGACLDHLCFVADNVPVTHRDFVGRGVVSATNPYRDYGSWISWLKDFDGNDIELLSPIPESVVTTALAVDKPIQTILMSFDYGKKGLGEEKAPPWREMQMANLQRQSRRESES